MRNLIIASLLVLACALGCSAYNAIKIRLVNETIQTFFLDEKPLITISGGQFNIRTERGTVSLALSDLRSYTFEQDNSDINFPEHNVGQSFDYDGSTITIHAAKDGCDVSLTTIDGIAMLKKHLAAETYLQIATTDFASGVYLLTINGASTKIAIP